jgi:hypothetical protein
MMRRLFVVNEQLFFPLNIEAQKAETRVMTYLARAVSGCDVIDLF